MDPLDGSVHAIENVDPLCLCLLIQDELSQLQWQTLVLVEEAQEQYFVLGGEAFLP